MGFGQKNPSTICYGVILSLFLNFFAPLLYAQEAQPPTDGSFPTGSTTPTNGSTPPPPPVIPGINTCTDTVSCLMAIMTNTYGALQVINTFPGYISKMTEYAISWLTEDKSEATKSLQTSFASLGSLIVQDYTTQNSQQQQLIADMYGQTVAQLKSDKPPILGPLPYINDLAYSTLLGIPPVPKGKSNPYNYIKNASGVNIMHVQPNTGWGGKSDALNRYFNYYNTVMSVTSFNGYLLSNQYADYVNGNSFTNLQNTLITEASGSNWIAEVATEELGVVFRQLLMFQSQSYVLLTQLIQIQKQLLTAQAMTNTLLIVNNQYNETLLVSSAQGVKPSI